MRLAYNYNLTCLSALLGTLSLIISPASVLAIDSVPQKLIPAVSVASGVSSLAVPATIAVPSAIAIPIPGSVKTLGTTPVNPSATTQLSGEVSKSIAVPLNQFVDGIVGTAMEASGRKEFLEKKGNHYNSVPSKVFTLTKDAAELGTLYKGFEQSVEGADVILDSKRKLKSKSAVELAKQKHFDELHKKVVFSMMQIAMGIGLDSEKEKAEAIEAGMKELKEIIGDEQAQKALIAVNQLCKQTALPNITEPPKSVSIVEMEKTSNTLLQTAMGKDEIVGEIKQRLQKYNGRSKAMRVTAQVVNTALSLAALTPTFVSPAAQVAWTVFIMCNGGSEEGKLLKEVYLGKRFESRWNMLNDEARLAVNSRNTALLTRNPALYSMSELFIGQMSNPAGANAVAESPISAEVTIDSASGQSVVAN